MTPRVDGGRPRGVEGGEGDSAPAPSEGPVDAVPRVQVRREPESYGPVYTGTAEELLATVCQMLDKQQGDARKARQMAREAQRDAAMDRIGAMRSAADLQLAAGIVEGAGQIASGACGLAGAGGGAEGSVDPTWKGGSEIATGTGTAVSGLLNGLASMNSADAELHRVREQTAGDVAEDLTESMRQAASSGDKARQKMDAVLQAQNDARRAAIRG